MAGHRIASLLKASPEGEGFHPSQTVTLSSRRKALSADATRTEKRPGEPGRSERHDKEGCLNAKDHPIFVIRQSSRGGGEFLCLDFQKLKGCEYCPLRRGRARA